MAGEIQLNSVSLATESGGTVTLNSSTDIKGCINASGSAPIYACRAWINFDGTSASIGTGRASGNVSGVTDNGTGEYTVTFTTAMSDANYAAVKSAAIQGANFSADYTGVVSQTTTAFRFYTGYTSNTGNTSVNRDVDYIEVAVFR